MNALNKYSTRFLLLLLPLMACSCDRKDIFNHEELYTGTVPLSLDWQGVAPDEQPDMHIHIWGTHTSDAREETSKDTLFLMDSNTAHLSLLETEYNIVAWHDADNLNFDGTHFRLKTDENGYLPEPGTLYACYDKFRVNAQQENSFAIKLRPYTRKLAFSFRLEAQAEGRIEAIKATLSGIASAKRLDNLLVDEEPAGVITWEFKKEAKPDTRAAAEGIGYSARKNLLGIHPGEEQHLVLTLYYTNGEQEVIEQNLTDHLRKFNNSEEGNEGLSLSANIDFAGQADATATIEDWKQGIDTDLDADN